MSESSLCREGGQGRRRGGRELASGAAANRCSGSQATVRTRRRMRRRPAPAKQMGSERTCPPPKKGGPVLASGAREPRGELGNTLPPLRKGGRPRCSDHDPRGSQPARMQDLWYRTRFITIEMSDRSEPPLKCEDEGPWRSLCIFHENTRPPWISTGTGVQCGSFQGQRAVAGEVPAATSM